MNNSKNKCNKHERNINNQHEWDPLREAVVGRWVQGTFVAPPITQEMQADLFPYIPSDSWSYLQPAENKALNEVYQEDDQRYHDEQENLVRVLEEQGVKVRRPDEIAFPVVATTQCYARDPIVCIGNKLLVVNLKFDGRRQETSSYTRIALELAQHCDLGQVVMMPPNNPGDHPDNAYLEGGDVFVDGNHVYVGMTGNATNDKGIEWLRQELGEGYTVHKIPLHKTALHLDCAMMLINETQGIICKEEFVDFQALPDRLKNRHWIEVQPHQAQLMATNGIVIDPSTILMIDQFDDVIQRVRDELGVKVIAVPFKKSNYFGGGLRCSYQPILRRLKTD